jgi:hypothetical protein
MSIIEWNNEGYPTQESLDKLAEIINSKDVGKAIETFYEALRENFYTECCGLTKIEVRGEVIDVWQYHTLGWSGNEDIIQVLQQSFLWYMFLERYDSGGHYYFQPKKNII